MYDVSAFFATLGVNTHLDATETAYGDTTLVAASLAYLGVGLIRDHAWDIDLPAYQALAADGIRLDLIVDGDPAETVAAMSPLAGLVSSFEGANETDLQPVSVSGIADPVAAAVAEQQALFAAVRASAAFATTEVIDQSVAFADDAAAYAGTRAYADVSNVHAYAAYGGTPLEALAPAVEAAPGDPVVITETGYDTLAESPVDASGVDESVQARLTLDTLMDDFKFGIAQTFLYELFDEAADPDGDDPELHYGLFHADGSPKPAADAIHALTSILMQTGPAQAGLDPTATGLPASGQGMVMGSAAGPTDIVLWAEPPVWDPIARTELAVAASAVSVSLGTVAALVEVYDPTIGTSPIASYQDVSTVTVDVTDHPIIIQVEGSAAAASLTPVPTPTPTPTPSPVVTTTTEPAQAAATTTSTIAATAAGSTTSETIGVFRFFDTTYGTHFYTADAAEAATIRQTRPDLVSEGPGGIGLEAIAPDAADPAAVPVYRFFDTRFGTHFFTASTAERDTIVASRADLLFEPDSVFYEHATAQGDDLPVYRFFDATNGTHFYTDSVTERATIVSSRPDLVAEGIAFYEPSR